MINTIIKRDGSKVPYNREKIIIAISKANKEVPQSEKISRQGIETILQTVESSPKEIISVEEVQDIIENGLMALGKYHLAKKYILYREKHSIVRQVNTTDMSILSLIHQENSELKTENANKNPTLLSTQRDYVAGETSRDLTRRVLLPDSISKAHDDGILHFHDMDYFLHKGMFNCCLVNIADMLENGTVMNGKLIEEPKSFQVACTVTTQIIAAIASNQYGGQSIDIKRLAKYLRKTRDKAYNKAIKKYPEEMAKEIAKDRMLEDLSAGIQTIQYQINTLMTTNGQAPFVTIFLHMDDTSEYEEEIALIIEEVLIQRLKGIKNASGVYVTPAFPKLVYVLDENNCLKGGKYDYLTHLAAKCSAKRLYPDYLSAKVMREYYDGEVFSPMGCRSFLGAWKDENGNYKWEGRFNQGVVSLNLPQIGIIANGDEKAFWKLLDERLELCKTAIDCRHKALLGTVSDVSPLHWQCGAIARLKPGEKIDKYLKNGYSSISLGYIGVYEVTKLMTGESHTTEKGHEFAVKLMKYLQATTERWKAESPDGLGYSLYGTPAESLCYRFARIDREKFGDIKDITDKGYYTNSFHVDVREEIDAFSKLKFEAEFHKISSGGCISYVEIPSMMNNITALESVIKFIYENVKYAGINLKSDFCHKCGFSGELLINKDNQWECPNCGTKMYSDGEPVNPDDIVHVLAPVRRTCGYLGEQLFNVGKTKEIALRVLHL